MGRVEQGLRGESVIHSCVQMWPWVGCGFVVSLGELKSGGKAPALPVALLGAGRSKPGKLQAVSVLFHSPAWDPTLGTDVSSFIRGALVPLLVLLRGKGAERCDWS